MSGTLNVGQAFEMSATRVSTESQYSKIVELVRKAEEESPPSSGSRTGMRSSSLR